VPTPHRHRSHGSQVRGGEGGPWPASSRRPGPWFAPWQQSGLRTMANAFLSQQAPNRNRLLSQTYPLYLPSEAAPPLQWSLQFSASLLGLLFSEINKNALCGASDVMIYESPECGFFCMLCFCLRLWQNLGRTHSDCMDGDGPVIPQRWCRARQLLATPTRTRTHAEVLPPPTNGRTAMIVENVPGSWCGHQPKKLPKSSQQGKYSFGQVFGKSIVLVVVGTQNSASRSVVVSFGLWFVLWSSTFPLFPRSPPLADAQPVRRHVLRPEGRRFQSPPGVCFHLQYCAEIFCPKYILKIQKHWTTGNALISPPLSSAQWDDKQSGSGDPELWRLDAASMLAQVCLSDVCPRDPQERLFAPLVPHFCCMELHCKWFYTKEPKGPNVFNLATSIPPHVVATPACLSKLALHPLPTPWLV